MNSFRSVFRALEYEIDRQKRCLEEGNCVPQETRHWDEINEERVSNNLPKISNQSQRDAYIGIQIEKERYEYKQAEAKALALNTYLKNGISEGDDINE